MPIHGGIAVPPTHTRGFCRAGNAGPNVLAAGADTSLTFDGDGQSAI